MKLRPPGAEGTRPSASTGPRSAAGKARSSMNALKTGIYSKSLIIPGEDPANLDTLLEEYFQRYCPAVPEQRDLVDILVRSTWTLRRLGVAEAQVWTYEMDIRNTLHPTAPLGQAFHHCDRTLTRLQRIVNSTQRNLRDALHELQRLQALELNLNPDPQPPESATPPTPETPQTTPQPSENEPVSPSRQFVSSSSAPPPSARRTAPKKPLPYHRPGTTCYFEPIDPSIYERCPLCFPREDSSHGQD